MECGYHVNGMLHRDQRTAKMWSFDSHVVSVNQCEDSLYRTVLTRRNKTLSHSSVPGRTSPHSSCKTRKSGHFWKSIHIYRELKHALIVGIYLGLLSISSPVSAAPLRRIMSSRQLSTPNWIDPCGFNGATASDPPPPNSTLFTAIVRQTVNSLAVAKKLQEEFAHKTFKMTGEQLHNFYKEIDFDWLPTKQIPKNLSQEVTQEHLDSLEIQPTLLYVYESLQKFAVVLERIVLDEEERNSEFKKKFENIANNLRPLLCEINTAIVENRLTVQDVTREDLPSNFKEVDNTGMNMRNWIVYRDYLNMLEYILQVFKHFMERIGN